MKTVVLAGGYATRLWPITRNRPKMFLPLGETTVIDRIYTELESVDRVDEVYVSTNERFADAFDAHLDESEYDKPRLSIEETTTEEEKLGVVGALGQLIEREGIDDDLLVIAGDNIFDFELTTFLDYFEEKEAPTIAAYDIGSTELATSYGVVTLQDERVIDFREKPTDPTGTRISIGCYAFPKATLSSIQTYLESRNDPDEPGRFIEWLHTREPTYAYSFDGTWFDVGTLDSYLDAVSWFLDGDSRIADTASLENTTVGSDVHVMDNVTLVDTDVEQSVIFPDVTLEAASVRRSVVDERATLGGLSLEDAMIGAFTRIPDGASR